MIVVCYILIIVGIVESTTVRSTEVSSKKEPILMNPLPDMWSLLQLNNDEATSTHNVRNKNLQSCMEHIVKANYHELKRVTYVDMNFGDDTILKSINLNYDVTLITRQANRRSPVSNEVYIIAAKSIEDFTRLFSSLTKEVPWNPYAKFLIVINSAKDSKLKNVFDVLMHHHILDVVVTVLNETDPVLYTYNPYEEYACGRYYNRIISYGKCSNKPTDIYPKKLATGLRKCTLNVAATHWPPYSVNPAKWKHDLVEWGTEQLVFNIISEIEQFKINYTYNFDGEDFSTITRDMTISGPLSMLQKNQTDAMLGGLLLISSRAAAFTYLYGHLDYTDQVKILVKKASYLPAWRNFYLEFEPEVWAVLLLALVIYSLVMVALLRTTDKTHVMLRLLDILLLHGYNIRCRLTVKCIFIIWIWSAYLVNCFYQSNLVSLTTRPAFEPQVTTGELLSPSGIKQCVSTVMIKFYNSEGSNFYRNNLRSRRNECDNLLQSITSVSKSKYLFTIVLESIYLYNSDMFNDEWGSSSLYSFEKPVMKLLYAIYLYKGFPRHHRLHTLMLRVRESGLVDINLKNQQFVRLIKHRYKNKPWESRFAPPWLLYGFGIFVAFIALVIEVSSKNKTAKK